MQLPPQILALAHNKLALAGVAGAGGLGLWVHSHKRAAPVDNGDAADVAGSAGSSAAAGLGEGDGTPTTYPNTYGTDLASALGDIDSRYADQVTAFQAKLGTDETALTSMQTAQSGAAKSLATLSTAVAALTKAKTPTKTGVGTPGKPVTVPTTKKPKAKTTTYKVKAGDTLSSIAKRYKTTVKALVNANHITNPNVIVAGKSIKIPG